MIRIGLAGLGVHGARYARHLVSGDVEGATLAAVSRADRAKGEAFAAENGVAFVADPAALAAREDVDAVVSVLPPDLHRRVAEAALAAGKPVLIEKPLAASVEDAESIARAAERTGLPVLVGHTQRFDPLLIRLREAIPSLGPLRVMTIDQRFDPGPRAWIDAPGRGGAALVTGVHAFDTLRWLTGAEIVEVRGATSRAPGRATEDTFAAVLRLEPGGILALVDNCHRAGGRSGRISVTGERGQLFADHVHRTLRRIEGSVETDLGTVPGAPTIVACLRAFVDAARGMAPPPVGVADGLAAVRAAALVVRG